MKMNSANFLIGLIIISISILGWIYLAQPWSKEVGPMSPTCIELRDKGYFETRGELTGHDSCIEGEYEWKENCSFIFPWWKQAPRCMYDYDNYNLTCGEKKADENYKDFQRFGTHCVTHPFIKLIWFLPGFVCIAFFALGLAILISGIKGRLEEEE